MEENYLSREMQAVREVTKKMASDQWLEDTEDW
jgi:hypothetical protein